MEKVIEGVVVAFWTQLLDQAQKSVLVDREIVIGNLATIQAQQAAAIGKITAILNPNMDEFLLGHDSLTLHPILEAMLDPVTQAFSQTVRTFYTSLAARVVIFDLTPKPKKKNTVNDLIARLDQSWVSDANHITFWPAQIFVNMFADANLARVFQTSAVPGNVVSGHCLQRVSTLLHGALLKFDEDSDIVDLTKFGAVNEVIVSKCAEIIYDAKILLFQTLFEALKSLLIHPLTLHLPLLRPEIELLATSGDIDCHLLIYIHLDKLLWDSVSATADRHIKNFIEPYIADCEATIDAVEAEIPTLTPKEIKAAAAAGASSPRNPLVKGAFNPHGQSSTERPSMSPSERPSLINAAGVKANPLKR